MTYEFLQHYWCFIVSLLGALLVFLLFVQGANSMIFQLGKTPDERRLLINSTGRKWEFTFTTLVTFGGAFFASFPLFYSTSFGGAYWLWMLILFTFVLQAVSYEFQNKLGNFLGPKTFQCFLVLNGILGPLLLGGAVATFFEGSNFIVEKGNLINSPLSTLNSQLDVSPVISHWANASHGLDALLNPWILVFAVAVLFLARTLGILYTMNNIADETIRTRSRYQLAGAAFVGWCRLRIRGALRGLSGPSAPEGRLCLRRQRPDFHGAQQIPAQHAGYVVSHRRDAPRRRPRALGNYQ